MVVSSAPTAQAVELGGVWHVFIVAGFVVYGVVAGLILWCVVAYRRRPDHGRQGAQFTQNVPLEIAWTVVPILVVCGLFGVTWLAESHVDAVVMHPANVVNVTAFRWSWRFVYAGRHVAVGGTSLAPPELVLPAGRTTQINLTSSDVAHAFWVPAFLFKRDAIPGMVNRFDLTLTAPGDYPARCAEYCGLQHAHMTFLVRVVTPAEFDRWLVEHRG